jgi:hypothetical protein
MAFALREDLRYQVPFEIIPEQDGESAASYVADFTYIENGMFVVEDVKGHRTAEYILKRKLMLRIHGIRIRETGAQKTNALLTPPYRKPGSM